MQGGKEAGIKTDKIFAEMQTLCDGCKMRTEKEKP